MADEEKPMPNTLQSTLVLFPLSEFGKKRNREEEKEAAAPAKVPDSSIMEQILFPREEDVLGDCLQRLEVDFTPPKRQKTCKLVELAERLGRTLPKLTRRKRIHAHAAAKSVAPPPPPPPQVEFMPPNEVGVSLVSPYTLFPYQIETIRWLATVESGGGLPLSCWAPDRHGGILEMAMGLGKTAIAACLVATTLEPQRASGLCTLYVCPKNVMGTVRYEFEKFLGPRLRILVYHRDFLKSEWDRVDEAYLRDYDMILTNFETVTVQPAGSLLPRSPWFRVIVDESHEIRNPHTGKFRALQAIQSPRRICLTGTSICNEEADLYAQLQFCGLRLPVKTKANQATLRELQLMSRVRQVDYSHVTEVKLPPKTVRSVFFDLSKEEQYLYDFYIKEAQLAFRDKGQARDRTAKAKRNMEAHIGLLRLMQLCSAPYLVTPAAKDETEDEHPHPVASVVPDHPMINEWIGVRNGPAGVRSSKMRCLVSLVASLPPTAKVVVFANYTSTLRLAVAALSDSWPTGRKDFDARHVLIHGRMPQRTRETSYTRFRADPGTQFLFMTLKLGSVGLNLAEADTVILLETWYCPAALSQAEGRVHRIGQVRPVNVFYLLGKATVEERIYRIALDKKLIADHVFRAADRLNDHEMQELLFSEE